VAEGGCAEQHRVDRAQQGTVQQQKIGHGT
jgi:hypothetical protein